MPPERWLQLTVLPPEPGKAQRPELLPALLTELGGSGVEESEEGLTTFLPPPQDLEAFLAFAEQTLREGAGAPKLQLRWRWQPHEEWETLWRRGLEPRRITERILVAPSWTSVTPSLGQLQITLDPGVAFGTAEHPTTRGCLRLLDVRVKPGDRVADVGAGSGILSIAAALLGAGSVLAFEMDPMACQAAEENLSANGVDDRIEVAQETVLPDQPLRGGPYQGVVANLQSGLLLSLFRPFRESLVKNGWLIASGILLDEREEVLAGATGAGFSLEEEDREEIWWSGAFRRSRCDP
jgi:ribosomal protein L11 methyltransferase